METKIELRDRISKQAKEVLSSSDYRDCHSREICHAIFSSTEYKNADTIFVYMPLSDEVDLLVVIANSFVEGKRVFIPRVNDSNGNMTFHLITPETKLEKGKLGILEPPIDAEMFEGENSSGGCLQPEKILAYIPGRAFTNDGKRLGRGGGYYDKFLNEFGSQITKIGVCFPFQLLDDIPTEENDCKVDKVISA